MSKPELETLLNIIEASAYHGGRNALSSSLGIDQTHYYDRITNPQLGDLVIETTSFNRRKIKDRVGRLISVVSEPYSDPDWPEDEAVSERLIWTIETMDGQLSSWENCNFIVVPEEPFEQLQKAKY